MDKNVYGNRHVKFGLKIPKCLGKNVRKHQGDFLTHTVAVADSAMGGPGGRAPIDQNLGLVMAARLRHGGKFSPKSLTFGHFLYNNVAYKKLSASGGPH